MNVWLLYQNLTSPFAPFIAEEIYLNLKFSNEEEKFESVHLSEFPKAAYT